MKNLLLRKRILVVFFLSFFLFILSVPSYFLTVRCARGNLIFSRDAPAGFSFILRFIHSVEQTPVEDEYRVVGGLIRQWEERVQSHNAGLPSGTPRNGRFLSARGWIRIQGGRAVFPLIRCRVGNSVTGRNIFIVKDEVTALYSLFPDSVLLFSAEKSSFVRRMLSLYF